MKIFSLFVIFAFVVIATSVHVRKQQHQILSTLSNFFGSGSSQPANTQNIKPSGTSSGWTSLLPESLQSLGNTIFGSGTSTQPSTNGITSTLNNLNTLNQAANLLGGKDTTSGSGSGMLSTLSNFVSGNSNSKPSNNSGSWFNTLSSWWN